MQVLNYLLTPDFFQKFFWAKDHNCSYIFYAETGHAPIQSHDPTGAGHGAPRIRQQPRVSPRDARRDGPLPQEARAPTDPAGSAAEPQPAVSAPPPHMEDQYSELAFNYG